MNLRKIRLIILVLSLMVIGSMGCKRTIMEYGEPYKKNYGDKENVKYDQKFDINVAGDEQKK